MTPAERARLIDKQEFEAECQAIRQRALQYAEQRNREDRERFEPIWQLPDTAIYSVLSPKQKAQRAKQRRDTSKPIGQQPRCARPAKRYTHNGEEKTLSEWSIISGVKHSTLLARIRKGVDFEQALTTKPGIRAKHHTINGEALTLKEWAERAGVSYETLIKRMQTHTLAEAIAMPADARRKTGAGVSRDFEGQKGTGAGSTLQEIPDITSKDQPA